MLVGAPLQYSCLENPMDGEAWKAAVHGVARNLTRLSDFTFTFHVHALEKEMATHSSVLAWRIPGMGKPGGLPSMGSQSRTRLKRLSSKKPLPLWSSLLSRFSRVRLCDPIDGSTPGSAVPGILQARTLEWVAISFSNA